MGDCTDIPLLSYSLDEASKELELMKEYKSKGQVAAADQLYST